MRWQGRRLESQDARSHILESRTLEDRLNLNIWIIAFVNIHYLGKHKLGALCRGCSVVSNYSDRNICVNCKKCDLFELICFLSDTFTIFLIIAVMLSCDPWFRATVEPEVHANLKSMGHHKRAEKWTLTGANRNVIFVDALLAIDTLNLSDYIKMIICFTFSLNTP